MDDLADDVVELLDHLAVSRRVILGGLSMGGYVALSLVLRHPGRVRGLMLMDTRAAADTPEAARLREAEAKDVLQSSSTADMISTMIPRLSARPPSRSTPGRSGRCSRSWQRTPVQGIAGALRGMAIRPDRRGELGSIAVPTLVMVGQDDVISPPSEAREIAAAIPGSVFEIVPSAGHLAPYENPSAANAAMLRFLEGLDPPPRPPARPPPRFRFRRATAPPFPCPCGALLPSTGRISSCQGS